jgi:hypothetical protein
MAKVVAQKSAYVSKSTKRGVATKKESALKSSKNYKKKYRGQGR